MDVIRKLIVVLSAAKDLIAACHGMRSFAALRMTDYANASHSYANRAHIWAITVSTVMPSARAEKFTAMR